ncbi:hypothetical protein OQA88_6443 [Cercophora sp. LCS_1]
MQLGSIDSDPDHSEVESSAYDSNLADGRGLTQKGTNIRLMTNSSLQQTERKFRLSEGEVALLEREFAQDPKPNTGAKRELAEQFGVELARINVWFQNRQAKEKQLRKRAEFEANKGLPDDVDHLASSLALSIRLDFSKPQSQPSQNLRRTRLRDDRWRFSDIPELWEKWGCKDSEPPQSTSGTSSHTESAMETQETTTRISSHPPNGATPTAPLKIKELERVRNVAVRPEKGGNMIRLERVYASRNCAASFVPVASLEAWGVDFVPVPMKKIPNPCGGFFQPIGHVYQQLYLRSGQLFHLHACIVPESPSEIGDLILGGCEVSRLIEGEMKLGKSLRA